MVLSAVEQLPVLVVVISPLVVIRPEPASRPTEARLPEKTPSPETSNSTPLAGILLMPTKPVTPDVSTIKTSAPEPPAPLFSTNNAVREFVLIVCALS